MPSQGAFIDCSDEDVERITDYATENAQSIHEFVHESEPAKSAKSKD